MKSLPHFSLLVCVLLLETLHAQTPNRIYRQYATQEVMARLEKENPQYLASQSAIERFLYSDKFKVESKKLTIPVVFHILYNAGEVFPSPEEINAQLAALNRDFGEADPVVKSERYGYTEGKFDKKLGKLGLSFCLAESPKDFKKEFAIRYIPTSRKEWSSNDSIKYNKAGGADAWDTERYLNIWVGKLADDKAGWAQMPGGSKATDGIVIDFKFIGVGARLNPAEYAGGKTLTHLVGTYLGVHELWNERIPCADDYVEDTPIHNAPNYGVSYYQQISMCDRQSIEMTMNFMDNSDDEQLIMFTEGQKARILAVLAKEGPRGKLGDGTSSCSKSNNVLEPIALEAIETKASIPQNETSVKVFPNPVKGQLSIEFTASSPQGQYQTLLYDQLGRIVFQNKGNHAGSQRYVVDCSKQPAGVYFIHVVIDGKRFSDKLIISQQ